MPPTDCAEHNEQSAADTETWRVFNHAGFVISRPGESLVRFELVMQSHDVQRVLVCLHPLGSDRLECRAEERIPRVVLEMRRQIPLIHSPELEQIGSALGSDALIHGCCEWSVPSWPSTVRYCGVSVFPLCDQPVAGGTSYAEVLSAELYVERKRTDLGMAPIRPPSSAIQTEDQVVPAVENKSERYCGFFSTADEVESRIEELIQYGQQDGHFRGPADEVETDALNRIRRTYSEHQPNDTDAWQTRHIAWRT